MKKNIFLLLLTVLIVFTLASCKLNDDSYVRIPEDFRGSWVVFNGSLTEKYFDITKTSIYFTNPITLVKKDLSFNYPGVKEEEFDAASYKPLNSVKVYYSNDSIGYGQTWNDTTIWLLYSPLSDTLRLIEVCGIDNTVKYNLNLIRR